MKFSEKYELLESLTTGAVETFAANDKVRGERVLVHIVECPPQKPDQSTSDWALESFRRVAPDPAGPVLETGKYSGVQYAYLVTKPADEVAVKSWVYRYELQSQDTKQTSIRRGDAGLKISPPAPAMAPAGPPKEPQPAPGQMTQLLRDFESLSKSRPPEVAPQNQVSARPLQVGAESGLHAAPWDPANLKPAAPTPKEKMPESFSSPAKPVSPEFASPAREEPKPGEFTSFFQGPFRGDAPSDVPSFTSEPIEPPRKSRGEFTEMFVQSPPASPTGSTPEKNASPTDFSRIFKMERPQATFDPPTPGQRAVVPPSDEPPPAPPSAREPGLSAQAPIFVIPPAPVAPEPAVSSIPPSPTVPPERPVSTKPSSHPGDGATWAFADHSAEPTPTPVSPPAGPSPYTQIISRSKLPAAEEGREAMHSAPSGAAGGGFAVPAMPNIPAPVPPPLPRIPPPPPMPKIAAPKSPAAPKIPKVEVAPPPPVSYWPLILTLTVLFFLAVLLVLYFVLKH